MENQDPNQNVLIDKKLHNCPYCRLKMRCAVDIWGPTICNIVADLEAELEDMEENLPSNEIRKEMYRRLARARGWTSRQKLEGCLVADIRDYFPRKDDENAYMGHRNH